MLKKMTMLLVVLIIASGCAQISKLAEQGLEKAKVEAQKYVDKQAGTGTLDESQKMTDDQRNNCLVYYSEINKRFDAKEITEEQKVEKKKEIDDLYKQLQDQKLSNTEFKEKCTEVVKK